MLAAAAAVSLPARCHELLLVVPTTLPLTLPCFPRLLNLPACLQDCQLSVVKPNPRQYVARISQLPGLEVWFQRATGAHLGVVVSGDRAVAVVIACFFWDQVCSAISCT